MASAQNGGRYVFTFLNNGYSAKIEALGGKHAAYFKGLPDKLTDNPAYTALSESNLLSLQYQNNYSGINQGAVFYKNKSFFTLGLVFVQYGQFTRADEKAFRYENFSAAEYAFVLNYAKKIGNKIAIGVNLKPILSDFYLYSSIGIASDWGVYYHLDEQLFSAAFVIKNLGVQIKPYFEKNYESLPLEMNLSISKKPEHAPFAVFVSFHNLQTPILRYQIEDPNLTEYTLAPKLNKIETIGDNILRHFIAGVEIFPDKNLNIQLGYNYKKRAEMSLPTKKGMSGLSMGFSLQKSGFIVEYSFTSQHIAGSQHYISIITKLSEQANKFFKLRHKSNEKKE